MEWRALLYVPAEIAEEHELKNWIKNPEKGIICRAVEGRASREELFQAADAIGVDIAECLMIVTTEKEWRLAQEIGLAALPYVPVKRKTPAGKSGSFSGAWIVAEGFEEADYDFFHRTFLRAKDLPWTVITTERCVLREFCMDDMDALFSLYQGKGITDHTEGLYPRAEEEAYERAYISNMYRYYGYGMWLVCKKSTGEVIGRAGLEHRDYPEGVELEMGYLIAAEEQNKGYATEVCRAMFAYACRELHFPRVNCLIEKDNEISVHLAKKLGFVFLEETDIAGKTMDRYIKYCFLKKNKI